MALALFAVLASLAGCDRGRPEPVTVAAASSLRAVVPTLIAAWRGDDARVRVTYGASGELRRQIEAGAPVDAILLAGAEPMEALDAAGRLVPGTRVPIARNELVLIGRPGGPRLRWESLDALPAGEVLAIGNPAVVPAGAYARQALERLGLWGALEPRLVLAADVTAVLAYVRRGEAAAGIVYRTEVRGIGGVEIHDAARPPWAPEPLVVAAAVRGGPRPHEARAFLAFVAGEGGRAILSAHGFLPPP